MKALNYTILQGQEQFDVGAELCQVQENFTHLVEALISIFELQFQIYHINKFIDLVLNNLFGLDLFDYYHFDLDDFDFELQR